MGRDSLGQAPEGKDPESQDPEGQDPVRQGLPRGITGMGGLPAAPGDLPQTSSIPQGR
jgi:hypothetical protein